MKNRSFLLPAVFLVILFFSFSGAHSTFAEDQAVKGIIDGVMKKIADVASPSVLEVQYPYDETIFPPEIVTPTMIWKDGHPKADRWLVSCEFEGDPSRILDLIATSTWTPEADVWEKIKKSY